MKQASFGTLVFLSLLAVGGTSNAQQSERLVWPPPPQSPRIEFLYFITSQSDIGAEKSFLRKAWEWLIGMEKRGGFLVQPLGVAVDDKGRIYVTDPGAQCVHIFDREEKEYETLSKSESGRLRSPAGVAVASNGRVYVTDSGAREVIAYDPKGNVKFTISGYFERPTGIVVHRDRLYVVDTAKNKILVFTLEGRFLYEFGKRGSEKGEFNFPVFIVGSQHLYVVDAMNFRVQVLDDSGTVLSVFGEVGNVQGTFANPKGIAVDAEEHIYVSDALFDAFQIFDDQGKLLLVVGRSGRGKGEFLTPAGLAIDKNNVIYVVDSINRRVQAFRYLSQKQ